MSTKDVKPFYEVKEEVSAVYKNLKKDNSEKRKDINYTNRKLDQIKKLEVDFNEIRNNFNSSPHDSKVIVEAKEIVHLVQKYFTAINDILQTRLREIEAHNEPYISNNSTNDIDITMSEKFCFKTAAALLPVMDDSECITRKLIKTIRMYDATLCGESKKLLTAYILNTRLSTTAELRLKSSYDNNEDLIADLEKFFLPKKSISALSIKLNTAKQGNKTIDEFGKGLEQSLAELTIAQAEGKADAEKILRSANEKIAINVFASGLNNPHLCTLIQARNFESLSEAVTAAQTATIPRSDTHQAFHMRKNNNYNKYQSRSSDNTQRNFHGKFSNNRQNIRESHGTKYYTQNQNNANYTRENRGDYKNQDNFRHRSYNNYQRSHNPRPQGKRSQNFSRNFCHVAQYENAQSSSTPDRNSHIAESNTSSAESSFFRP